MKRLIILAALVIGAATFNGVNLNAQQGLMPGNSVSVHLVKYELLPGISDDEVIGFLRDRYRAGFEESFQGIRTLFMKGDRGECKNRIAFILIKESTAIRDKYFPEEDRFSELADEAFERLKPIDDEMARLVKSWSTTYTDWVVLASSSKNQGFPVKGNILGLHTERQVLAPDVAEHVLVNFHKEKWGPEWEKNFPGTKMLLLKGVRGENKGRICHLVHFDSMEVRNTYWADENTDSEITQTAMEKILPVWQEFYKTADFNTISTDWLIE
jgi:hypothetical protein